MAEYIKREAAKDAVCKAFVRWGSEDQYHESTHQIDRIHAADVVPVRHGRWEHIGNSEEWEAYVCSVCDMSQQETSRFCPCCGAKMDLED